MRKSRPFRFKRFQIAQERAAMKVGTDGVLLGAWCTIGEGVKRALDIGTGTGLIALMLAQRGEMQELKVDAIEPEKGAYTDACENITVSPWPGNISIYDTKLQHFTPAERYDLIACNPPYFTSSLLPPSTGRVSARHDVELAREELIAHAARLTEPGARFAVVIPAEQAGDYITDCDLKDFSLARRTDVKGTLSSPAKRALLEFIFKAKNQPTVEYDELVIETAPLKYTPEYMSLTREFYLKF